MASSHGLYLAQREADIRPRNVAGCWTIAHSRICGGLTSACARPYFVAVHGSKRLAHIPLRWLLIGRLAGGTARQRSPELPQRIAR